MEKEFKKPWNKILAKFGVEVNFEQMKLADGVTVLEAESFEPNFSVGIVTADGIVPAPVGEHETEDGQIIVVEVEGQIKEVKAKSGEEELAAEPGAEVGATTAKKIVETVSKETFFAEMESTLRVEFEATLKEKDDVIAGLKVELSEAGAKAIVPNPEAKNENKTPVTAFEKFREHNKKFN